MPVKTFPKSELKDLVYEDETDNLVKVRDEVTGKRRWSIDHELIFKEKATEKFYSVHYSVGATEQQDESPFEYESDNVEVTEVRPVEKTIIDYVAV